LYVIGTNRHESRRIDRQLRGRAGRQGDPGTSCFFISLEDPLFARHGLAGELRRGRGIPDKGEIVGGSRLLREIEWGQRLVEAQNYEIRRTLWRYSRISELHRVLVQDRRREILSDGGGESLLAWADPERYQAAAARIGTDRLREIERRITLHHLDRAWSEHLAWLRDTRESIHLVAAGGRSPLHEFQRVAAEAFGELEKTVEAGILETFASLPLDGGDVDLAAAGLKGPSSTWTYLVNDRTFEEIARPQNIGFHAVAIAWWGPIWLIPKMVRRWRARREKARTGEIPGPPGGTAAPPCHHEAP
jgi:preprotein translocase subunit SecA